MKMTAKVCKAEACRHLFGGAAVAFEACLSCSMEDFVRRCAEIARSTATHYLDDFGSRQDKSDIPHSIFLIFHKFANLAV